MVHVLSIHLTSTLAFLPSIGASKKIWSNDLCLLLIALITKYILLYVKHKIHGWEYKSYKDKHLFAFYLNQYLNFAFSFDFSSKIATILTIVTKSTWEMVCLTHQKEAVCQVICIIWIIKLLYYSVLGIGGDFKMRS